mgnify:FL=1|jgi:hypothetical protein
MDERTQFTFYASFFDAVSRIKKKADRADAYDAICAYALREEEPDFSKMSDAAQIAFLLIKPNLDSSRRKAKSGKDGGSKKANGKKNESKPEANSKQEEHESEKEKEIEKEGEIENECYPPTPLPGGTKAKRFIPPTVDEVAAYCQERGNSLDPDAFVDFYASKGWMVGKNPMKDWKAAVRTWERSEGRGTSGAGNRVQPRATEEHGLDKLRRLYEEEFGVE